ncbi:hypothetical protein LTR70_000442 [Exophiala xenobiotica]|uniref:Uncharacterized protein n=1 Tax=Lithohypha guttulata TaxID=1690604 RepID=A0ABR0KPV6_9EURO|nr:hypothetical protein LTR24_000143 [Lithohypha guttulata]KAK5330612.1 hypothetical protein LTR70_000442 [Exophiala xenobiotica]
METRSSKGPGQAPTINIQSKAHEKLLNVIDHLRSQGVSRYIDLPQLIVCGDQSSGKSSVLEAVSSLKFPTKDALCTRFATELILRRNPEVTSTVTIIPDLGRPIEERDHLAKFDCNASVYDDLGYIIEQAGRAMGLNRSSKVFSADVLRIELSGPQQPHLTLVDLPGLFHAGSKSQTDADAGAVKTLVTNYMKKPRGVILAVVSAKNDYNNQIVTKYARDADPQGARTLGIITKPDTLPVGSDSEKLYFDLAEGKDVDFQLGWHVLKNRDYKERNCSNEERDQSEVDFFSKPSGIWASLNPNHLGIGSDSERAPSLIADVAQGIQDCEARLGRLGPARATVREQRRHLHTASDDFTSIIKDAINGRYESKYFGDADTEDGYARRIRAVINNLLEQFSDEIKLHGHKYEIVQDPPESRSKVPPYRVSKAARLAKVKDLIKRNRGKELATISKEETITALFRDQSSPWIDLVNKYARGTFHVVRLAIFMALEATCDPTTRDGIVSSILKPTLEEIKNGFDAAVETTLQQHSHGHPITFNSFFQENIQRLRNEHSVEDLSDKLKAYFGKDPRTDDCHAWVDNNRVNVKLLMQALLKTKEEDIGTFAASEAHHTAEAFYQVALKQFVDDFAVHAVEQALLVKIENLFTPGSIFELEDELIADIAGETEQSQIERESSEAKLRMLRKALDILKRLDRGHTQSMPTISKLPNAKLTLVDSHEQGASLLSGVGAINKPAEDGMNRPKEDRAVALSQPDSFSKHTHDEVLAPSVVNPAITSTSNDVPRAQRQRRTYREGRKRRRHMTEAEKQERHARRIRRLSRY